MPTLYDRIHYGSVEPQFYEENRLLLDESNYRIVSVGSLVLVIINIILDLIALAMSSPPAFYLTYGISTVLFFILFLIAHRFLSRHKEHTDVFYYIFFLLAFSEALVASTVLTPTERMVTVYFVIIILPVLYIEQPLRSYLSVIIACVVSFIVTYLVKASDPTLFYSDCMCIVCCFLVEVPFIALMRDVNLTNIQAKRDFEAKAETDELTGVYNHDSSELLISKYLCESDNPCALFIMDIDDFKLVNDTLGHMRGDEVLHLFGRALKDSFRSNDIVGRLGGDEFIVLLEGTDSADVITRKADEIASKVGGIYGEFTTDRITCSIGAAMRSERLNDFKALYDAADKALYRMKAEGKGGLRIFEEHAASSDISLPLMLVVDDTETGRAVLRACFKGEFAILEAADGQRALELIHEYAADLDIVLLDMRMPVMDGEEVIRRIRSNAYIADLPIIVISAYGDTERSALELGATDMVAKPIDPEVCRLRVRNALALRGKDRPAT